MVTGPTTSVADESPLGDRDRLVVSRRHGLVAPADPGGLGVDGPSPSTVVVCGRQVLHALPGVLRGTLPT